MIITNFDQTRFLSEYWQKKPCIIRGFIPDFVDPIDEHELAGLAQEQDIDSRVVSCKSNKWTATQGPFDDFTTVCIGAWTLLVQGVDRYIDEVDELTELVNFIPNWRLDDVMISFSNEGAGVGPHTDEYDVFIIQGKGERRWQVGLPDEYKESIPHSLLKQIEGFTPIIDEVLKPGDVVYIPPKHPHNGVALSDCINYSIGFRAPSSLEVLTGIIDENIIVPSSAVRYTDPQLLQLREPSTRSAAVDKKEIEIIKQQLFELLQSEQAEHALLQMLSRQSLPNDDEAISDYALEDVHSALSLGTTLARMTGVKPVYATDQDSEEYTFFIDGNRFSIIQALREPIELILNNKQVIIGIDVDEDALNWPEFTKLVTELINAGYWVFLE
ncbi:MAG: 50S ribosomal protein L16 3-hydroxylase [Glaciecola sp.]|jgi:50S ribosomal protein L16 3-hydroxylase